nr:polyprenyl synthetase family protein [Iodidimonas nitroreducens]
MVQDFSGLEAALGDVSHALGETFDALLPVPESDDGRVVEAMRYALFAGGKRLRPFLLRATADLFGVSLTSSLRAGAAIECIHSYSLVHDDLPAMDDDDLRRGKPTVHKAFDEATAILAGDALLTFAFEILSDESTHADPRVRAQLVSVAARASGHHGMVGGQMLDLAAEHKQLTERDIIRLQQMKTGALIVSAVEMGAVLGKASTMPAMPWWPMPGPWGWLFRLPMIFWMPPPRPMKWVRQRARMRRRARPPSFPCGAKMQPGKKLKS